MNYRIIIGIGFLLVSFGMVAPFLMVLRIVESTYWLSFLSFGSSVAGLFLGIIGAAFYVRLNKK
jgi:hypothetical protein